MTSRYVIDRSAPAAPLRMSLRYPLADLVRASGLSEAALARKVRLAGSTLKLARERGLTEAAADRYAVRAGLHPLEVWPEMVDEAYRPCAAVGCERRFIPTRKGHVYCSRNCRDRVSERLRYHRDPAHAARKRAARRRYYQEVGQYERARERRKYEAKKRAA